MRRFSLCHGLSTLVAALAVVAANPVHAQLVTPAGLNPGDTFRFVFLTPDSTVASSTNIGTYDAFVTTEAGGVTYNGTPLTWQAIGSTASVSAATHIGNNAGLHGIYLTNDVLLSTGPESQLWSNQTIQNPLGVGPTGSAVSSPTNFVWTGSNADGTTATFSLGALNHGIVTVEAGNSSLTDFNWIADNTGNGNIAEDVYAISNVVTVSGGTATPEPGSLALLTGLSSIGGGMLLRRRRARKSV